MTPKEKLTSFLDNKYVSEDGEEYQVKLLEGLGDEEIESLKTQLPKEYLPEEIRELLTQTRGFEFHAFNEIIFDSVNHFGFEEFFPNSVQLAGDGFGNFWILDIDDNGNWGCVFYVCHDPAVVVKHSENLTEFISHIDEFGRQGIGSHLDEIHEKVVLDIWEGNNGLMSLEEAKQSADASLTEFAEKLSENYVIADLRKKLNKTGFAWGKFGPNIENAKRHGSELIWAIEKPEKKKWGLSKLFGK